LLLAAVVRVLDDPSNPPEPNARERATAAAIRADPVLVAAAVAALAGAAPSPAGSLTGAGLAWVAAVKPELLDAAARAAASVTQLAFVPDANRSSDVAQLTADVKDLKPKVAELLGRVKDLEDDCEPRGT
jgi:hypothetical protein